FEPAFDPAYAAHPGAPEHAYAAHAAANVDPDTEQSLPPEHRSPADPRSPDPRSPRRPHRERHPGREFAQPMALVPPEAEPRVTRLVDVINDRPEPAPPTPRPKHEQTALVVDDFAWDIDDPEDYSAPA